MANAYAGTTFTIDTTTNYAGLVALKGSDVGSADDVVLSGSPTLTFDPGKNVSILKFNLGATGNLDIVMAGYTLTHYDTATAGGNCTFYGSGTGGRLTIDACTIKANTAGKGTNQQIAGKSMTFTGTTFDAMAWILVSPTTSATNCDFKNSAGSWAWIITGTPLAFTGCSITDGNAAIPRFASNVVQTDAAVNSLFTNLKVVRTSASAVTANLLLKIDDILGTLYYKVKRSSSPWDTAPTWSTTTGVQSLTANNDGTVTAAYGAATSAQGQAVGYRIYVRAGSAPNAFGVTSSYLLCETPLTSFVIARDPAGGVLDSNNTYYVVVRAVDQDGNEDGNTTALSKAPSSSILNRIDQTTQTTLALTLDK